MSLVKIQSNASGTGTLTIAAPNTNTDRTLTLPDNTGTVVTSASSITASQLPAGSVLQMVEGTMAANTGLTSTSSTFIDIGLSASITPAASGNKIVCIVTYMPNFQAPTSNNLSGESKLVADGNDVFTINHTVDNLGKLGDTVDLRQAVPLHGVYTTTGTSAITVKIQSRSPEGFTFRYRANPGRIILMEIKA
jgi:hypothetical protein